MCQPPPNTAEERRGFPDLQQLRELLDRIKPEYRVDEAWLRAQRVQLRGAIEVMEEGGAWRYLWNRLMTWFDEVAYFLAPAQPVLIGAAALVLGIVVGRFLISGPAEPVATIGTLEQEQIAQLNLQELIQSGQVKGINVSQSDDPENPVQLDLTVGQEMTLTGSTDREDILAALEYVLVKDPNPGERLESANILGQSSRLEERPSAVMALLQALLTDPNPGVRMNVIRNLQGLETPLVKDALIKTVMDDESEGVRLAAIDNLASFLDDLSVRSALLLVSRMDPSESVRYKAYQTLSEAPESLDDNLEVRP